MNLCLPLKTNLKQYARVLFNMVKYSNVAIYVLLNKCDSKQKHEKYAKSTEKSIKIVNK